MVSFIDAVFLFAPQQFYDASGSDMTAFFAVHACTYFTLDPSSLLVLFLPDRPKI
jgi:hypothetical protein